MAPPVLDPRGWQQRARPARRRAVYPVKIVEEGDRPPGGNGGPAVRALPRPHRRGVPASRRAPPGEEALTSPKVSRSWPPRTRVTPPRPGRSPASRWSPDCGSRRSDRVPVHFGEVEVVRQVTSFTRRDPETGQLFGEGSSSTSRRARCAPGRRGGPSRPASGRRSWTPGSTCQGRSTPPSTRPSGCCPCSPPVTAWDIGGVSADLHPATGQLTVFVYDGNEGGAGFAERGSAVAREWLTATAEAITSCECQAGRPFCIQSPKCGTGNEPLTKAGALLLLRALLAHLPVPPSPRRCRDRCAQSSGSRTDVTANLIPLSAIAWPFATGRAQ